LISTAIGGRQTLRAAEPRPSSAVGATEAGCSLAGGDVTLRPAS